MVWNDILIGNIRDVIKESGYMQKAVAVRAGFTEKRFSDMLNGRKTIKASDIPNIAKALNVQVNDLYTISKETEQKGA